MAGHVFIVRGDIRRVACDAWLMPCGADFRPRRLWWIDHPGLPLESMPPQAGGMLVDTPRVRRVANWPRGFPIAFLTDVGGSSRRGPEWYVRGVEEFLRAAVPVVRDERFLRRRDRPLLALPLVGTGGGGAASRVGEIVRALLPALYDAAEIHDVDIVLDVYEGPDYAAAVHTREKLVGSLPVWPETLSPRMRRYAARPRATASRSARRRAPMRW